MKFSVISLLFSCIASLTWSSAVPEQQWEPINEEAMDVNEAEDGKITKILSLASSDAKSVV